MVKNPFKVMPDGSLTLPQGQTPSFNSGIMSSAT